MPSIQLVHPGRLQGKRRRRGGSDLAAHKSVTEYDVKRAAEVEELAVQEGLGDVAAHRRTADRERAAVRRELQAAQQDA